MKRTVFVLTLFLGASGCSLIGGTSVDPTCRSLREFVASVGPGATRQITFNTKWGGGFTKDDEDAVYAKACSHDDYGPARAVCKSFMEHGAVEFSGLNATRAVSCLSPQSRFAPLLRLESGEFRFTYGTEDRGAWVNVRFNEDPKLGGMALSIVAKGY